MGHIATAEGDTVSPDGGFLVSMNKWAIDRFNDVGPLLPQNFQLIDIAGEKMQLLYDAAHSAGRAALRPDHQGGQDQRLIEVYPEVGTGTRSTQSRLTRTAVADR